VLSIWCFFGIFCTTSGRLFSREFYPGLKQDRGKVNGFARFFAFSCGKREKSVDFRADNQKVVAAAARRQGKEIGNNTELDQYFAKKCFTWNITGTKIPRLSSPSDSFSLSRWLALLAG